MLGVCHSDKAIFLSTINDARSQNASECPLNLKGAE